MRTPEEVFVKHKEQVKDPKKGGDFWAVRIEIAEREAKEYADEQLSAFIEWYNSTIHNEAYPPIHKREMPAFKESLKK